MFLLPEIAATAKHKSKIVMLVVAFSSMKLCVRHLDY